jgi:hypothetical protein
VLATFELTERTGPGAGCGEGIGGEVRTLFGIEDGKIAEWLRAPDPATPGTPPGPGGGVI